MAGSVSRETARKARRLDLTDLATLELLNALAFAAFVPFLALWLAGPVGLSPLAAGAVGFGVYSLTAAAGGIAGGRLADQLGRRTVILVGLSVGALRLAAMAMVEDVSRWWP